VQSIVKQSAVGKTVKQMLTHFAFATNLYQPGYNATEVFFAAAVVAHRLEVKFFTLGSQ
jgi:hypothetical protein